MIDEQLRDLLGILPEAIEDGRVSEVLVIAKTSGGIIASADSGMTVNEAGTLAQGFLVDLGLMVRKYNRITRRRCRNRY